MDADDLAERARDGTVRLHALEEHADPETAARARRRVVADAADADLDALAEHAFGAADVEGNVENLIGAAHVPMGVAGPLPVEGGAAGGEAYVPIATTEGALVASLNRGCGLLRAAGGATARVLDAKMTRAPVFRVEDVAAAHALAEWIEDHGDDLADAAEATTDHGEVVGVEPYVVGDSVFARFAMDTKDAMGMNMVTIAVEAACEVIEDRTPADLVALSGNLCTDKKPAAMNAIEGRGRTVAADALLPREVVEDRLDATPEAIAEINTRKNHVGSAKAGALGFNAHAANVVAGVFLATGQDAAQVVEGSNAITTAAVRDGDLYASLTLASLEVGTVGGGTDLPTQRAALDLLGVAGGGDPPGTNADALAERIAAAGLAAELSLLGALASRNLSSAHASLGR